jgi:hypothetical protein
VSGGFWPLPHAGHEKSEADTHVESYEDVLSDAGSTPAASTIFDVFTVHSSRLFVPVPPPPLFLHISGRDRHLPGGAPSTQCLFSRRFLDVVAMVVRSEWEP